MVMHDKKFTKEKNAPLSQAILLAMWIRRYNAEHIAQYGRSRAILDATGSRHWASVHPILPRQMPFGVKK
jgi:hypothetical protein